MELIIKIIFNKKMEGITQDIVFQLLLNSPDDSLINYFNLFRNNELFHIAEKVLNDNDFWYQKLKRKFLVPPENKDVNWKAVYKFLSNSLDLTERFIKAATEGCYWETKILIDNGVDPSVKNNSAIRGAVECGHTEVVKLLLQDKRVDPSVENNYAIRSAAQFGQTEVVKLLLQDPRVDPTANGDYAIRFAAVNGRLEVVKVLLQDPRVDPTADDNLAIRHAASGGKTEVVKLLLQDKRVDPTAEDNYAIRLAARFGEAEVVKLLLQDPRVNINTVRDSALKVLTPHQIDEIEKRK